MTPRLTNLIALLRPFCFSLPVFALTQASLLAPSLASLLAPRLAALKTTFFLSLVATSISAKAGVLFEGAYKIVVSDVHVGFSVQRFEYDQKLKQFRLVSFVKQKTEGLDYSESMQAASDENLNPIYYSHATLNNKVKKTLDYKFKLKGDKVIMTGILTNDKDKTEVKGEAAKGTFLSQFLAYMILKSPKGLQANSSYKYSAIFEESGEVGSGEVKVGSLTKWKEIPAYKVINQFGNYSYVNYITEAGEVLTSEDQKQPVKIELMASLAEAQGAIPVKEALLKNLFGTIPSGNKNVVHSRKNSQPISPSKTEGLKGGQGIQLKGQATDSKKN